MEIFTKWKKENWNCIGISVFGHESKEKYLISASKNKFIRHFDLLFVS